MIPPGAFPLLRADNHRVTSPALRYYNCIAWAAGDSQTWWWPDADEVGYWPPGVPRHETIEAFIEAYRGLGFELCQDADLEDGFEKVTIYALRGLPTHAARQLANGNWSSKLGVQEDIEHEREALDGPVYGAPVVVLRRSRAATSKADEPSLP